VSYLSIIAKNLSQFAGMFFWTHFLWAVIRTFDSKLVNNPDGFAIIEDIPSKWREFAQFRDFMRKTCNRDKPRSYLLDMLLLGLLY
jgi:hypothetical protein